MDIMKMALKNRKKDLEEKLSLKVDDEECGPEEMETAKMEDDSKKSGLAPSVKDQAPEKVAFSEKIQPDSEDMDDMTEGMPEVPIAREPNTLGEKVRFGLEEKYKKSKMNGSV